MFRTFSLLLGGLPEETFLAPHNVPGRLGTRQTKLSPRVFSTFKMAVKKSRNYCREITKFYGQF